MLKVVARDRSLWNLFRGNETVIEKKLTIDVTPPTLELIADDRYVNFGGVGVIVYKPSPDTATSGVKIGDYFFPGFAGQIKDHPDYFLAFFAHAYNVPPDARAMLVATDKAGNTREMALVYELKNVKYKKSTIALSDGFLQKVAPLLPDIAARQGTPNEVFVASTRACARRTRTRSPRSPARPRRRCSGRAPSASSATPRSRRTSPTQRTYTYNNEPVDTRTTSATTCPSRSTIRSRRPTAAPWPSPATSASTATP